jgi:2',3'-cyclic-nucleotide 2'-phosphodiesterase (5'-nucleotidase family)
MSACTAPAQAPPDTPPPSSPPSSPSPATDPSVTATSPAPAPPGPGPIRIALAGDVHFEGVLAARLRDPATALAPASAALAAADLAIVNLETSVGTGGRPEPGKRFTFSAGPAAFEALGAAGVDVATMANNHALDFGRRRLPSTLRAVAAARTATPTLTVIGVGRTAREAFAPALVGVGGTVVATIAASLAAEDPTADPTGHWAATAARSGVADAVDPARLLATVRRADGTADVVVVYLHWGIQGDRCPTPAQRRLATRLVDAGADVVAGTHAHVLQGDGRLGGGYVAYGLGNFAWYSPGPTGVLTLTVQAPGEGSERAEILRSTWWPAQIGTDGLATRLRGAAATGFHADRELLRACAGLAD